MSKIKNTYSFLAVTILVAIMANVVLPTSLAAARYVCNAEYAKVVDTTKAFGECCSESGPTSSQSHYPAEHAEKPCPMDQVCEQALTSKFSDTPVILPTAQNSAILVSSLASPITLREYSFIPPAPDAAVSFFKPPLFLLNSAFLN